MMMSTSSGRSNKFPFTASQWQELEHQALIFKYMVSGIPIPPDLLFSIKRSLDSSLSSKLMLHQSQHIGWNCFQMGVGRKIDPEPGRCRRTDGKKWRCSKEAYPDSKYCERHMHRGRNRSRKPVETSSSTSNTTNTNNLSLPTAIPISSITRNNNPQNNSNLTSSPYNMQNNSTTSHHSISSYNNSPLNNNPFLYPNSSSSRTSGFGLESNLYADKDYRNSSYGQGIKEEIDEHPFFSESSGTMRSISGSSVGDSSWHLEPLTMGSSVLKQRTNCSGLQQNGYSYLQLTSKEKQDQQHYYMLDDDVPLKLDRDDEPQKVMHHFFDEWPKNKDSWLETEDKLSNHGHLSTTQLSISMPKTSHHDFFMTHKW